MNPIRKVINLLEAWAARETRGAGRNRSTPSVTHRWAMSLSKKGNPVFNITASDVCLERSTVPKVEDDRLDDFYIAFCKLEETDQMLILVSHFEGEDEWRQTLKHYEIPKRLSQQRLRVALLKLVRQCQLRSLV